MAAKFLGGILVLVIAFVMYVAAQPAEYHVERTVSINAPTETVFSFVNDFHQWPLWSPGQKLDPNMRYQFEGPPEGVGSRFSWQGNKRVGIGQGTITDSNPGALVRVKFEFTAPFTATNSADFLFQSDGPATVVTWSTTGKQTFISKFFSLFFSVDKKVGAEFEKGLASLKEVSESAPAK